MVNFSEDWLNIRISFGISTSKNLRENYTWTTAINGKNENCRNWPNVCTEFVLTLRGDTLEFLSSSHKK